VQEFITRLAQRDIHLKIEENNICCTSSTASSLFAEERNYIRDNKPALLAYLRTQQQYAAVTRIFPLSYLQQGMLFHYLQDQTSDQYLIQVGFKLSGNVNVGLFKQAWQEIINSHDILCARFVWNSVSHPVHVIHQQIEIEWHDYSIPESNIAQELGSLLRRDRQQGFDLSRPCCMRFHFIAVAENSYYFVWTKHHIILDGWSAGLVLKQVFSLYEQLCLQSKPVVASKPSYQGFINWLYRCDKKPALDFWRSYLVDFKYIPPLNLRAKAIGSDTDAATINISKDYSCSLEESIKFRQFVQTQAITLNTLFQYAWAKLLSVYSNKNDVAFGVAFSGRSYAVPAISQTVGLFVNTLPVRVKFQPDDIIDQQLSTLHATIPMIDEHGYISLTDIKSVTALTSDQALFHTLFSFENYWLDDDLKNKNTVLQVEQVIYQSKTNFPLQIQITPGEIINIRLVANNEYYSEYMVEQLSDSFKHILHWIVEHASNLQIAIPTLSVKQEKIILHDWNNTHSPLITGTMHAFFKEQVERTPHAVALSDQTRSLTFAELNNQANFLAASLMPYFSQLPPLQGQLIAICLDRNIDVGIAILAIWKLGAAYLPLDPSLQIERMRYIVADATISLIIGHHCYATKLTEISTPLLLIDDIVYPVVEQPNIQYPAEVAYVLYTSGSTGQPKGVVCYHHSILNRFNWYWKNYPFMPDERCIQKAALTFVDSIQELFCPLLQGIRVDILAEKARSHIGEFLDFLLRHDITRLELVPSLLRLFLGYPNKLQQLVKLRWWIVSGEELTADLAQGFRQLLPQAKLLNRFGSTEASTTLWYDTDNWQNTLRIPIGKPISNVNVYILNDLLQPVPIGVAGQLHISGQGLAQGYLHQPSLNAERFIYTPLTKNKLFRSGDIVRWLEDGTIEYNGRADLQVKINGIRIDLTEIEAAILQLEFVKEVVILARDTELHKLICYLVYQEERQPRSDEVLNHCQHSLPLYMVPSVYIPLAEIPLTAHGKRDLVKLSSLDITDYIVAHVYAPPKTELEKIIIECCQQVLQLEKIGIYDNFFALGGDSIAAIKWIATLQRIAGIHCAIHVLFQAANFHILASDLQKLLNTPTIVSPASHTDSPHFPLSSAQRRIWFLEQMQDDYQPLFHITHAIKLWGDLDIDILAKACDVLVQRQDSLRMAFKSKRGDPYAELLPPLQNFLVIKSIVGQTIEDELIVEANKPFDLEQGYLFRFTLFSVAAKQQILLLVFHHIISDAWSTDIFLEELSVIYKAICEGKKPFLPALSLSYIDFSIWQENYLQSTILQDSLTYWQKKLSGYQNINLTTDFVMPKYDDFAGKRHFFTISPNDFSALKHLAKTTSCTVYTILLAMTHVLLSIYSRQEDIVIGTPITHRQQSGLERVMGLFLNLLALRNCIGPVDSFRNFLEQVKTSYQEAFQHQWVPFEHLIEMLPLSRESGYAPLFQVLMVLHTPHFSAINSLVDVVGESMPLADLNVKYDLVFSFTQHAEALSGFIHYKTALFKPETIEQMAKHLTAIIHTFAMSPDQQISSINLMTSADSERLAYWSTGKIDYPFQQTLQNVLINIAKEYNENITISDEVKSYSYQTLYQQAQKVATHLSLTPDSLVVVCMPLSHELIIAVLAILLAGGAYVPIDPTYPEKRIQQILSAAHAKLVLTQEKVQAMLHDVADSVEVHSMVSPHHLAYVIYTSGTTGVPKGVMIEQQAVINYIHWLQSYAGLTVGTRVDCSSAFAFDFTVTTSIAALLSGAMIFLCPEKIKSNPQAYLHYLQRHQINFIKLTPSYFRILCLQAKKQMLDLSCLQTIILGGETLNKEDCQTWLDLYPQHILINEYGPTETTVAVSAFVIDPLSLAAYASVPIGYPCDHTTLHVLNEHQQPLPIGLPGEIFVEGACLARGYLHQPELTAQSFVTLTSISGEVRRLYKTGDRGRWTQAGILEYLGRSDEQIKLLGYRLELAEIAAIVKQYPGIADAIASITAEHHIVAYYIADAEPLSVTLLTQFVAENLPRYMLPTWYIKIDHIPLTVHGKLDLKQLPDPKLTLTNKRFVYPRTELEWCMADIWMDILQQEKLSVTDNFFERGGHSLLSIQLISRINEELAVELKIADLFRYPTIETLCAAMQADSISSVRIVPLVENPQATKPLFIVPGSAGNPYSYLPLAKQMQPQFSVYGVRHPGWMGDEKKYFSIQRLAAFYIEGILSVQPRGPFIIAGHSFGGLVAYQIACQLEEEGQLVEELIILDTAAPRYLTTVGETRDEVAWLIGIANVLASYTGLPIELEVETLSVLSTDERYVYYLDCLVRAGVIPPTHDVALVKMMIEVHRAASLATKAYQPLPYEGVITLIKAENHVPKNEEVLPLDWGWGELTNKSVKIFTAPGDHITMIVDPYVQCLGDIILKGLCKRERSFI
jgi:amino acid adenylation domain-containing protein